VKICEICDFAEIHGHFPDRRSHCEGCHTSWGGHAECHCGECHRHFSGDSAFQAHRVNGECRDPSLLIDKHGDPRFRPAMKSGRVVWVRAKDFEGIPASASRKRSKRPKSNEAPARTARSAVA
jgi:hypothetical protein